MTPVNSGSLPASTYVPRSAVGPTKGNLSSLVSRGPKDVGSKPNGARQLLSNLGVSAPRRHGFRYLKRLFFGSIENITLLRKVNALWQPVVRASFARGVRPV